MVHPNRTNRTYGADRVAIDRDAPDVAEVDAEGLVEADVDEEEAAEEGVLEVIKELEPELVDRLELVGNVEEVEDTNEFENPDEPLELKLDGVEDSDTSVD